MTSNSRRFQLCKSRFGGMAMLGPRNWQAQRQCEHRTRPVPTSPMSDGFLYVTSRHVSRLTAVRHLKQTQVPLHIARTIPNAKAESWPPKNQASKPSSFAVLIQSLIAFLANYFLKLTLDWLRRFSIAVHSSSVPLNLPGVLVSVPE
jgi:hypothetical protein